VAEELQAESEKSGKGKGSVVTTQQQRDERKLKVIMDQDETASWAY